MDEKDKDKLNAEEEIAETNEEGIADADEKDIADADKQDLRRISIVQHVNRNYCPTCSFTRLGSNKISSF